MFFSVMPPMKGGPPAVIRKGTWNSLKDFTKSRAHITIRVERVWGARIQRAIVQEFAPSRRAASIALRFTEPMEA